MKKLLIAAAVAALCATGANAADMVARTYTKAPVAVPMYNWSGLYIGGDFGGEWTRMGVANVDPAPGPLRYDVRRNDFSGGAHIGYQRQWGQFVLGIEGAYLASAKSASLGVTPSVLIFFPGGTGTGSLQTRDIWSVGGRGGWAFDNWLPYVTGGYASGRVDFSANDGVNFETGSVNRDGGYIGAGLGWAPWRNGVIVGVEYRHYEFNDKTTLTTITPPPGELIKINSKADTVMGRVSYKFGPMFGAW